MAQVKDILNPWGRQKGPNPQRSDLWQVDLTAVIAGLRGVAHDNPALVTLPFIPRYFTASISLPELKVRAEPIRRDSRSYNMPSWDEPVDAIRMTFIVDDGGKASGTSADGSQSTIYTILDIWRAVVRAGRGEVTAETSILLDAHYRIDYAFPVYVYFLKGLRQPNAFTQAAGVLTSNTGDYGVQFQGGGLISEETVTAVQQAATGDFNTAVPSGLDIGAVLRLDSTWLAGFKLGELNYNQATVLTIEASFYTENIRQMRRDDVVPSFL